MTIALDFDGTFTADPEFWMDFIRLTERRGHEVLIVSCRADDDENRETIRNETGLQPWRIKLTSGSAKRYWMERTGWKIDVWIDDEPKNIENGK